FAGAGQTEQLVPQLLLGNVKLFCSNCKRTEAFSPTWYVDASNEMSKPRGWARSGSSLPGDFQLFCITYECQSCKKAPEAVLIRREGWQFSLDGRSPMETVDVPSFIPKAERHHFRDAIVAIHAGKTLAALFYLRTFIEQFARRQTQLSGKVTGEEIMTEYSDTLPARQRDQMPSLREWYERLSVALHAALGDETLFEDA